MPSSSKGRSKQLRRHAKTATFCFQLLHGEGTPGHKTRQDKDTLFSPPPRKLDEHRPFLRRKIAKGLPEELDVGLLPSAPGVLRHRLRWYNGMTV